MSEVKQRRQRTSLLVLAAVFVLPVVLAKLALDNDWFNKGSTNRGQLLEPALDAGPIFGSREAKWRVMYLLPQQCDASCEHALFSLNQIWVALGKNSDRVEALVVATTQSDQQVLSDMSAYPHVSVLTPDNQSVNKVFKDAQSDGIFLVDTLDNVILRYPLYQEQQQAVMASRDILADMRKLLKLSRIG